MDWTPVQAASDFPFQLILLILAGVIAALGKAWEGTRQVRDRTRRRIDAEKRREKVEFVTRDEEPRHIVAPQPGRVGVTAPPPIKMAVAPAPRPPRRPPRAKKKKKRKVVRRVIKRTIRHSAPAPSPAPGVAAMLRSAQRTRIREAIVLREVLGPPLALRRRWRW